jgi:hypothetical protein
MSLATVVLPDWIAAQQQQHQHQQGESSSFHDVLDRVGGHKSAANHADKVDVNRVRPRGLPIWLDGVRGNIEWMQRGSVAKWGQTLPPKG